MISRWAGEICMEAEDVRDPEFCNLILTISVPIFFLSEPSFAVETCGGGGTFSFLRSAPLTVSVECLMGVGGGEMSD